METTSSTEANLRSDHTLLATAASELWAVGTAGSHYYFSAKLIERTNKGASCAKLLLAQYIIAVRFAFMIGFSGVDVPARLFITPGAARGHSARRLRQVIFGADHL
jgi:hypothetical protein